MAREEQLAASQHHLEERSSEAVDRRAISRQVVEVAARNIIQLAHTTEDRICTQAEDTATSEQAIWA